MSLSPGEDIPQESHTGSQFFRIEEGKGVALVKKEKSLIERRDCADSSEKHQSHYIKIHQKQTTKILL
jgi:mannose-6-phosphate isomerase-like protein (cupin superfamily)